MFSSVKPELGLIRIRPRCSLASSRQATAKPAEQTARVLRRHVQDIRRQAGSQLTMRNLLTVSPHLTGI